MPLTRQSSASSCVNIGGQVGQNMDTVAQRIVNNEMDCLARHARAGDRQHPGAEPEGHDVDRQQVAVRLSRLVAELAVDEHAARAL